MRPVFFSLMLLLASTLSIAQMNIDSTKNVIRTLDDKEEVDALNELAINIFNSNPDQSDSLARSALALSLNLDYAEGRIEALKIKGARLSVMFEIREANKILIEALSLAREVGYQKGVATVNYTIGSNYIRQGLYDLAAENFIEGLSAAERLGVDAYKIGNLLNLGIVYVELKQLDQAERYFNEGLAMFEGVGLDLRKAQIVGGFGYLELRRGNYALSEKYYLQATKDFKTIGATSLVSVCWINLGEINSNLGRGKVAISYLDSALNYAQGIKDTRSVVNTLYQKGRAFYRINRYPESQEVLVEALALQEGYAENPYTLFQLYELAVDLNKQKGDYAKALFYKTEAIEVKDSLDAQVNRNRMAALTVQSELDKFRNQANTEAQNIQIELLKVEQRNIVIIGLLILLLGGLVLWVVNRNRLRVQLLMAEKDKLLFKQEAELKSQEISEQHKQIEHYEEEWTKKAKEGTPEGKVASLIGLLGKNNLHAEDWATFRLSFENYASGFFLQLEPYALSPNEERLSALIKLGLATKEMAQILAITPNSIHKAKSRLGMKLNLPNQEIDRFIKEL